MQVSPASKAGSGQPLCADRDLPYCQASLFGSYAQALRYLNATGRLTRAAA